MSVLSIISPHWFVTLFHWWVMASMVTCWLKVRGTAGWDLSDMTTQVHICIYFNGLTNACIMQVFVFNCYLHSIIFRGKTFTDGFTRMH